MHAGEMVDQTILKLPSPPCPVSRLVRIQHHIPVAAVVVVVGQELMAVAEEVPLHALQQILYETSTQE